MFQPQDEVITSAQNEPHLTHHPTKKPSRRRFTDEYKLRILEEIDACTEPGQISALLRREKLYSSYLVEWRQARAKGELGARPKPAIASSVAPGLAEGAGPLSNERLAEAEKENRKLQERLRQAELILDIQEKTLKLFGVKINPLNLDDICPPLAE
jgi:transposase-like protein